MKIETFPSRGALADGAADVIARALAAPGARSFAATGGTTPGPVYDILATRPLPWNRLTVTLTDERWVAAGDPLSNEGLVRAHLLKDQAASATFLPLKADGKTPEDDAAKAEAGLRSLLPFAVTLLGMGSDGHIASLFPGAPCLTQALDPAGPRLCIGVDQAGLDPHVPRISLTARTLLESALIVVLITGEEKHVLVERIGREPGYAPPVAAILRQSRTPVRVLWAA